jgi:hypothetical protein
LFLGILEEDDEDESEDQIEAENTTDPSDLEKIFNERSNALVSVSTNLSSSEKLRNNESSSEKKTRRTKKKDIQLNFDLALLRLFELEHSHEILLKTNIRNCSNHSGEINRNCFDCSLINIIP